MLDCRQELQIAGWLAQVRGAFKETAPELLYLFDIYAAEAAFGWRYLATDLGALSPGAKLIEVGAGSLLLSCQLVRAGFDVTALEPTGTGFSHFDEMRIKVLEVAAKLNCLPKVMNLPAEDFATHEKFDFAFSINVMEHVGSVHRVIANVGRSLAVGAFYRFTCPNYIFPYEPHFNIPTLFSKKLTGIVFRKSILDPSKMPDPHGTWKSLNWINVVQVRNAVRRLPWLSVNFSRQLLVSTLERIALDPEFASRRSPAIRGVLSLIVRTRLHLLLRFVPAMVQPIMDCRLQKISDLEVGQWPK